MLVQEYKSTKKVKPKNDLMYQDIYNCICQNTQKKDILSIMSSMVCQIAKACRSTVIRHRSDAKVCRPKGLGYLDPVSIFDKTSYRKISQNLEAVRFFFRIVRSLWNLTGTSAALSKRCDNLNYQSRGYETSQDFTITRLIGYWNGALGSRLTPCGPGKHSCVKGNVDTI